MARQHELCRDVADWAEAGDRAKPGLGGFLPSKVPFFIVFLFGKGKKKQH